MTFEYNGKLREVICTEDLGQSLKGYDISYLDEKERTEWRDKIKDLDLSKLSEEEATAQYNEFKQLMKTFRHFKKSQIKEKTE
jgi:hypothetical protein